MDGVIADSEPFYYDAINGVLAPLDKQMSPELQRAVMGYGVAETWDVLARELALEGPLDDLIARYDRELCRRLADLHTTLPGVPELIEALRHRKTPIAVASSSWPGWIEALLEGTGLTAAFDAIVSATMVQRPKPAPDIYLLAAESLGVPAEQCIAIEDTPTGLASAKAAGMYTVQVRAASTAFPPQPTADLVLDTLQDFDLSLLAPQPQK